ncbi:MAG: D-tyrosyl-tRNA(Tyr) deacylase [SAR202 cluster bacterium Io17-Chloro-G9]|nr:MAG: D-tyrosyl-tRNA(Tyr) deacylase [SAR202 cluster bacterium Io17-Chloro-G9]
MRALVQRVAEASVEVDGEIIGNIGPGLLVFLGLATDDEEIDARYLVEKIANLRVFSDEDNRFNRSALEVGAEFLVVSQFTLYADTRKGRRPDFSRAAAPDDAKRMYEYALALFNNTGLRVASGTFQAYMQVRSQNDGPVTLLLDSADRQRPRRG